MPRDPSPANTNSPGARGANRGCSGRGESSAAELDAEPGADGRERHRADQRQPVGAGPAPADAAGELAERVERRRLGHQPGEALDVGAVVVAAQRRIGIVCRPRSRRTRSCRRAAAAGSPSRRAAGAAPAAAGQRAVATPLVWPRPGLQGQGAAAQQVEGGAGVGEDDGLGGREHAAGSVEELPAASPAARGRPPRGRNGTASRSPAAAGAGAAPGRAARPSRRRRSARPGRRRRCRRARRLRAPRRPARSPPAGPAGRSRAWSGATSAPRPRQAQQARGAAAHAVPAIASATARRAS